ncbi:MAG: hypothetical protein AAF394_12655, partial [Planctomycetota bacterium]
MWLRLVSQRPKLKYLAWALAAVGGCACSFLLSALLTNIGDPHISAPLGSMIGGYFGGMLVCLIYLRV